VQTTSTAPSARVVALVHRLSDLVRERGITRGAEPVSSCSAFEEWLSEARTCGVRAVETFAERLEQDGSAVWAALTEPWSNTSPKAKSRNPNSSTGRCTAAPASMIQCNFPELQARAYRGPFPSLTSSPENPRNQIFLSPLSRRVACRSDPVPTWYPLQVDSPGLWWTLAGAFSEGSR